MEFDQDVQRAFGGAKVAVIDAEALLRLRRGSYASVVNSVIDEMGRASARAQSLGAVITTSAKLVTSTYRLYLMLDGKKALGLLKVGRKKLFIRNEAGAIREIEPMCVLDFYVHESCQRMGLGKIMFSYMAEREGVEAPELAYDRPSHKFLSFLGKYYHLKDYVPQNNNFVVFNAYFDPSRRSRKSKPGPAAAAPRGAQGRSSRRRGRDSEPATNGYGPAGMVGAEPTVLPRALGGVGEPAYRAGAPAANGMHRTGSGRGAGAGAGGGISGGRQSRGGFGGGGGGVGGGSADAYARSTGGGGAASGSRHASRRGSGGAAAAMYGGSFSSYDNAGRSHGGAAGSSAPTYGGSRGHGDAGGRPTGLPRSREAAMAVDPAHSPIQRRASFGRRSGVMSGAAGPSSTRVGHSLSATGGGQGFSSSAGVGVGGGGYNPPRAGARVHEETVPGLNGVSATTVHSGRRESGSSSMRHSRRVEKSAEEEALERAVMEAQAQTRYHRKRAEDLTGGGGGVAETMLHAPPELQSVGHRVNVHAPVVYRQPVQRGYGGAVSSVVASRPF